MSENKPAVVQTTDISKEDLLKIERFIEVGAPGFDLTDTTTVSRMMDLYLGGKTYSQIARVTRSQKELVMLYSHRLKWYTLKMEYLQELELHLKGRIVNAKVASQDFLLQLSQMYQKKIGAKMDKYLATNNEQEADKINLKEIDKYLKIVEALQKISSDVPPKSSSGQGPAVGINVGDGVTVTKSEDGSVEITPKQKTMSSMLEMLANQRRAEDLAKNTKTSDIKNVTPQKNEGEGNENK